MIFYVYYDHITGETSHYFIILVLNKTVHIFQSAVFEYSIAEWLGKYKESILIRETNEDEDERNYYANLAKNQAEKEKQLILDRIDKCILNRKNKQDIHFDEIYVLLKKLEGSWSTDCKEKCDIFTKLFACKMDYEKYKKLFNNETKEANFKFIYTILN